MCVWWFLIRHNLGYFLMYFSCDDVAIVFAGFMSDEINMKLA